MTRRDKALLKYIVGLLILILTTIYCGYIVLFEESKKEPKTVLYLTETKSGRDIFYKEVNGEVYTVTQEEIQVLLNQGIVEVIKK